MKNWIIGCLLVFVSMNGVAQSEQNSKLDLKYEFKQYGKEFIHVKAKLVNNTDETIYFLSESCNGLDYFIAPSSDDVEIHTEIHCNATYPIKNVIKPNSEYEFKLTLKNTGKGKEVRLKLNLFILNKDANMKGRTVKEVKECCIIKTVFIHGPSIKLNTSSK